MICKRKYCLAPIKRKKEHTSSAVQYFSYATSMVHIYEYAATATLTLPFRQQSDMCIVICVCNESCDSDIHIILKYLVA